MPDTSASQLSYLTVLLLIRKYLIVLPDQYTQTWFSHFARHPARKRSGSILTIPEPTRGIMMVEMNSIKAASVVQWLRCWIFIHQTWAQLCCHPYEPLEALERASGQTHCSASRMSKCPTSSKGLHYVQWRQRVSNIGGTTFPFPSPLTSLPLPILPPLPPSPPLPLEVGPFNPARGSGGALLAPPAGSGAEPPPKSNLVHFSLKIRHLVAKILMISKKSTD